MRMNVVRDTLWDVSTHSFYVNTSEAMKKFAIKVTEVYLKTTFEKYQSKYEDKNVDDVYNVEFLLTVRTDAMSVGNDTAANICDFDLSYYRQYYLFVNIAGM